MSNPKSASGKARRGPATMPDAAPPPAPPPPVVPAQEPSEPAPPPVTLAPPAPAPQSEPEQQLLAPPEAVPAPPAAAAEPQPGPEGPVAAVVPQGPPQGTPGTALAAVPQQALGNSLARNLATQNASDFASENSSVFTRTQVDAPIGLGGGGFGPGPGRTREDNLLGKKRHPRQERGQMNPGMRRFLADGVTLFADDEGIGKGVALDVVVELGLRVRAPGIVARAYGNRAAALGAMNDWPDGREELLEMVMRQCDEAMVLRVLERLKSEAQGHQ